jgi:hypothetical protein
MTPLLDAAAGAAVVHVWGEDMTYVRVCQGELFGVPWGQRLQTSRAAAFGDLLAEREN